VTKIRHQGKNRTNRRWIFNFCKIPWNSGEILKFRSKGKIPRLGSKFRGSRKTVGPMRYCFYSAHKFNSSLFMQIWSTFRQNDSRQFVS